MTALASNGIQLPKWAMITFGLLSVIAGVLALAWPGLTILVLVALLGVHLLIYGVLTMIAAFQTGQGRVLAVIFGVLSILAGTSLWLRPMQNIGAVVIVISVFWVVGGVVQTISALVERDDDWGVELLSGLLSLGAGIVTMAWPGITLLVIAINAGIWMILIGVMRIWMAFRLRSTTPAMAT